MRLRPFLPAIFLCLIAAGSLALRYINRAPAPVVVVPEPSVTPVDPAQPETKTPVAPEPPQPQGQIRLSNDADAKAGDYWLEQVVHCGAGLGDKAELFALYLSLNPQRLTGTRARVLNGAVVLEASTLDGEKVQWQKVTEAKLDKLGAGEHVFGALWRGGELSLWLGGKLLLTWKSDGYNQAVLLNGRSGAATHDPLVQLKARRALALNQIQFNDNFMRDGTAGPWQPLAGRWELTKLAFPERSANPFSLRAAFGAEPAGDDRLYQGRIRENDYGLGIMLSPFEGTLHVARITGDSPAARAGLQEDDIFLEIAGYRVEELNTQMAYALLMRGYNTTEVTVKILRPGEKQPRQFRLNREHIRWGVPATGTPLEPITAPVQLGGSEAALITAGESGWSDYVFDAAVKHVGVGGSALVFGMVSNTDYYCFRWLGPAGRSPVAGGVHDRVQLVRVNGGVETILAQKDAAYRPYEFYRLSIDWQGHQVRALIDGNEVLAADVPELRRGKIGLAALRGEPVYFDDVRVAAQRQPLQAAAGETKVNQIFALENDMAVWGNPALEWDRDLKTGWAVHRARFRGEQSIVLQQPRFDELTVRLFSTADTAEANVPALTIKDGRARFGCDGWNFAEAAVGKGPFKRISLRASGDSGQVDIDGQRLEAVRAPKSPPLKHFGRHPNDRVALKGLKNLGAPSTVRVAGSQTLEYSFDAAPTDWKVASGRWGLLNKWICDPRWSWFGGRTKTMAALWNKQIFGGDQSVEAHVALMMLREELGMPQTPVERAGDYNLTICGDGQNADSGYTLVFGGDNNIWTRLYRKGKLVAESTDEDHRVFGDRLRHPTKPELHQRWFHLKLEKIGSAVSFYRDGKCAFTFIDPEPLQEGRTAFWTLDNGFLLSRVRIAYDAARPAPFETRTGAYYEDPRVINIFDGEVFTRVEPLVLPETIAAAFSVKPQEPMPQVTAEYLPPPREKIPADRTRPWAYRVTNASGGGPFSLQWRGTMDPETRGVLRFAYCIEPGAQVDLYLLDVDGKTFDPRNVGAYRWRLTGPKQSTEQAALVGEIPNVVADGQWHTVQFDLQPSWRRFWRDRGMPRPRRSVLRLFVGNLDNQDYLLAGFNANRAGAAYAVSDISVLTARETDFQQPDVKRVIWPHDTEGDGRNITVEFSDGPDGSGVADETLQVHLNEQLLPHELLDFDPVQQRLQIDLLKINANALADGPVRLRLGNFSDRAGNPSRAPFAAEHKFELARAVLAKKPLAPPLIKVSVNGAADRLPGAAPLTLTEANPIGPIVSRLQQVSDAPAWAAPGQQRSVQVTAAQDGTSFGFFLNNCGYSLRRFPFLQLDYKIPPQTPVNLHLQDNFGMLHALVLTDAGDAADPLSRDIALHVGPPPDLNADNTWRQTVVPLQRWLTAVGSSIDIANVNMMGLYDNGWRASRRGQQYWIHRIQPLPAGNAESLSFTWSALDLLPITDYAASLDTQPASDPAGKKELMPGETLTAALLRKGARPVDGWHWLHVKVRNAAGVWSAAAHQRFFLDRTPPVVIRTEPSAGTSTTSQTVKFHLRDDTGIDIRTLRMVINGQVIHPTSPGVSYDAQNEIISFNALLAGQQWREGTEIKADLQNLADIVGNRITAAHMLNFRFAPAADTTGPAVTKVGLRTAAQQLTPDAHLAMETSFGLNFEQHFGQIQALQDCKFDWLDDPAQSALGRRAAKFTALDDHADVQIMLHRNAWYLDRMPMLQFDYRAEPGFNVDLLVEVLGQMHCIKFTGSGIAPAGGLTLGSIADVKADATWRHASVDLQALLERAGVRMPYRIVSKIMLSAQGQDGCRRGATLLLDNVDLCDAGGEGSLLEWEAAPDPSGIAGFSVLLDQNATAAAPEILTHTTPQLSINARTGVWYLHVRACDQAGNWGPQRSLRVDFGE